MELAERCLRGGWGGGGVLLLSPRGCTRGSRGNEEEFCRRASGWLPVTGPCMLALLQPTGGITGGILPIAAQTGTNSHGRNLASKAWGADTGLLKGQAMGVPSAGMTCELSRP